MSVTVRRIVPPRTVKSACKLKPITQQPARAENVGYEVQELRAVGQNHRTWMDGHTTIIKRVTTW